MSLSVCYVFPSHMCAADENEPASSPEFEATHIDDEGSTMGSGDIRPPPDPPGVHVYA